MDQNSFVVRAELLKLIRKLSYREGEFTLSSGKKSQHYCNLKTTSLHPDGAYYIGQLVMEKILDEKLEIDGIGGLTLGADPLATAISLVARKEGYHWPAFIVRKEPQKHGASKYIEGLENFKPGAKLLVLEDTLTTGASSMKAVLHLREEGFEPVAVFTIVDREEGGREVFDRAGIPIFSLFSLAELKG